MVLCAACSLSLIHICRVTGLACIDEAGESEAAGLVIFHCNQLVIATGGEAAAYWDSVYPCLLYTSNREYTGCLVNFKTEKPSYKVKHSIENPVEKQAIFENLSLIHI